MANRDQLIRGICNSIISHEKTATVAELEALHNIEFTEEELKLINAQILENQRYLVSVIMRKAGY